MVTKTLYHQVCGMIMAIGLMGIMNCFFPFEQTMGEVLASAIYIGAAAGLLHYSDYFMEKFGITEG